MTTFTDRELDLMAVLWREGSATVAEMRDALADPLAYTTVLTVLRTLEAKGYVDHREEGRAFRYFPLVARQKAGLRALARIRDAMFGGSPEMLMLSLVSDRGLTAEELRGMRRTLNKRLEELGG